MCEPRGARVRAPRVGWGGRPGAGPGVGSSAPVTLRKLHFAAAKIAAAAHDKVQRLCIDAAAPRAWTSMVGTSAPPPTTSSASSAWPPQQLSTRCSADPGGAAPRATRIRFASRSRAPCTRSRRQVRRGSERKQGRSAAGAGASVGRVGGAKGGQTAAHLVRGRDQHHQW